MSKLDRRHSFWLGSPLGHFFVHAHCRVTSQAMQSTQGQPPMQPGMMQPSMMLQPGMMQPGSMMPPGMMGAAPAASAKGKLKAGKARKDKKSGYIFCFDKSIMHFATINVISNQKAELSQRDADPFVRLKLSSHCTISLTAP